MIAKTDLFGIFSITIPNGSKLDSYYKTVDAMRPLFQDEEFVNVMNGFYVNRIGSIEHMTVRISYFVSEVNKQRAVEIFTRFFSENGMEFRENEEPHEKVVATDYGGEEYEERFRNFLVLQTRIGLEIMSNDLLYAQRLLSAYRFQIQKELKESIAYFDSPLQKYSSIYCLFSDEEKKQFIEDLCHFQWYHFLVNLILGCDWNLPANPRLSIPTINEILTKSGLEFKIPEDWIPCEL